MTSAGTPPLDDEDEGGNESRLRTPKDIMLRGASMAAAPLIIDPQDGLPRPADEGFVPNAVQSLTDETMICTEGGPWVKLLLSGETRTLAEQPGDDALVLVAFDRGRRVFVKQGDEEAQTERFVRARPACEHYAETLSPPDGLSFEGHDKVPLAALRQCTKLDIDLFDQTLYGCNQRAPRDVVSEQLFVERARKKAAEAKLARVPMFKEATFEERQANGAALPEHSQVEPSVHLVGLEGAGAIFVEPPTEDIQIALRRAPHHLWFPDRAWQPAQERYNGQAYTTPSGEQGVFSASLSGEIIVRSTLVAGQDPRTLVGLAAAYYRATVKRVAEVLASGRNVVIVPYWPSTGAALVRDVTQAFEKLSPPAPPSPSSPDTTP